MQIDKDTIQKIAHLARLKFCDNTEAAIISDLQKMVDWVDKLKEIDTEGVEPLHNMTAEINQLREDKVLEHLPHNKGLDSAPKKDSDYFRVPKVLEQS